MATSGQIDCLLRSVTDLSIIHKNNTIDDYFVKMKVKPKKFAFILFELHTFVCIFSLKFVDRYRTNFSFFKMGLVI